MDERAFAAVFKDSDHIAESTFSRGGVSLLFLFLSPTAKCTTFIDVCRPVTTGPRPRAETAGQDANPRKDVP